MKRGGRPATSNDPGDILVEFQARLNSLARRDTASLRAVRREFSQRLMRAAAKTVTDLALRLLDGSAVEYRFVAYELLAHHRAALASLGPRELEQFGRGIDSWGAVDTFACYLAGRAWRMNQVKDRLIHGWARSPDRWWRRAALVSTVPLNNKAQGGTGDAARTLKVCDLLVGDLDDMVIKAMSWALRELAKRDPQAVRHFVAENEKQLAARVVREVRNKLDTGLKNPRQRSQP